MPPIQPVPIPRPTPTRPAPAPAWQRAGVQVAFWVTAAVFLLIAAYFLFSPALNTGGCTGTAGVC